MRQSLPERASKPGLPTQQSSRAGRQGDLVEVLSYSDLPVAALWGAPASRARARAGVTNAARAERDAAGALRSWTLPSPTRRRHTRFDEHPHCDVLCGGPGRCMSDVVAPRVHGVAGVGGWKDGSIFVVMTSGRVLRSRAAAARAGHIRNSIDPSKDFGLMGVRIHPRSRSRRSAPRVRVAPDLRLRVDP